MLTQNKSRTFIAFCLFFCLAGTGEAYTVVQIGKGVPESIEQSFLASTTAQYNADIVVNPFFPNTYQLTLTGINPLFNPPITNAQLLDSIVTVDSYTYVYGWASGVSYQQTNEIEHLGGFGELCGYATNYNLIQASTMTWDPGTCQDAVTNIVNALYQESLSTVPVLGF